MKLSKKKRAELKMKFGGRCAYCGIELGDRWQADHVEPVVRQHRWVRQDSGRYKAVHTGVMDRPERNTEDNLFPTCPPCNNDKHASSLEEWRGRIEDLIGVCQRNHSAYRHALRFGLVTPNPRPIVFYFEQLQKEITNGN